MTTIVSTLTPQTLESLRTDLRLIVGDNESLSTSYSDSTMNQALNFSVQHYLLVTGRSYIQNTLTLTSGEATLPSAYIQVGRVGHGSPNSWLLQSSVTEETNKNPLWESLVGNPKRWVMFDGQTVRVTPVPSNGTLVLGYVEEPTAMADKRTITAITLASSGVVTSANHNFSVGRKVQFGGITTMTQLNNQIGTITATTTNTFTVDINTTSYTAFGSGTGYAYDLVDPRVPITHQRFLKYAAAYWLLLIDGDTQSFQGAAVFMQQFMESIKEL